MRTAVRNLSTKAIGLGIGLVLAVLALAPAALADTGTPINGSIKVTYQFVDPAKPNGAVTVYAQGQWNWDTHSTDCNADRAGAGVAIIWGDNNEPDYPVSGKDVHGNPITYKVGVAQKLNGDT